MNGQPELINVLCGCGRSVRFRRDLVRESTRCPACGGLVVPPPMETAVIGPPCPHCGRPWPVDEKRCPSCLARHRSPGQASVEPIVESYGADPSPPEESGSQPESQPSPPRAFFAPPPSETPANARVDHWHQKPTTLGWALAAGAVGLLSLVFLVTALSSGSWAWAAGGAVLLGAAAGLWRGSGLARGLAVVLPVLVLTVEATLLLGYGGPNADRGELAAWAVIVSLITAGLSVLTFHHGRHGTVIAGGVLTAAGLASLWASPGLLSSDHPAWPAITTALRREAASLAPGAGDPHRSPDAPRGPAPCPPRAAPAVFAPFPAGPASPTVVEPEVHQEAPALADAPAPAQAADPALAETPATMRAGEPVPDWQAAMAAHGFRAAFADLSAVRARRCRRELDGRTLAVVTYAADAPGARCAAVVYEDFAGPDGAPTPDDLVALARLTAGEIGLPVQYETWRSDVSRPTYFIRLTGRRDERPWSARVESRVLGHHVLVAVAQQKSDDNAGKLAALKFFRDLQVNANRK